MRSVNFELQISEKKCVLYKGKYGKACNFSSFVNISSEIFLEELSPLDELRNYGNRWGKLRRVRKHQGHPEKNFCGQSEAGNSNASGTGLVRVIAHFIDPTNCPWVSEDWIQIKWSFGK